VGALLVSLKYGVEKFLAWHGIKPKISNLRSQSGAFDHSATLGCSLIQYQTMFLKLESKIEYFLTLINIVRFGKFTFVKSVCNKVFA